MAVAASSLVKLFSAEAIRRLYVTGPYMGVVRDRSAEMMGRKELELTDTKRTITLNARTSNNANFGTAGDPDTQSFTLVKDKDYDFNEGVPWLDELEVAPSLAQATEHWSMVRVVNQISADIRAKLEAAQPRQTWDVALKTGGQAVAGTPHLRNLDGAQLIIDNFQIAQEFAEAVGMGMMPRAVIVPPSIQTAVNRFFTDKGRDFPQGALGTEVIMGRNVMAPFGWAIIVDPTVPDNPDTAGNNKLKCHFVVRNHTIDFGQQLNRTRIIPDPYAPRNLYQGLLAYGALVVEAAESAGAAELYSDVPANTDYAETLMRTQFDLTV